MTDASFDFKIEAKGPETTKTICEANSVFAVSYLELDAEKPARIENLISMEATRWSRAMFVLQRGASALKLAEIAAAQNANAPSPSPTQIVTAMAPKSRQPASKNPPVITRQRSQGLRKTESSGNGEGEAEIKGQWSTRGRTGSKGAVARYKG